MTRRDRPIGSKLSNMLSDLRQAGVGDARIARESGLSLATIFRLRAGIGKRPSYQTVSAIERVFERKVTRRD